MKYYNYIIIAILFIFFSGCTAKIASPTITMKEPHYIQKEPQIPKRVKANCISHEGSIFGKGQKPLFSDKKAMKINDLVTIIINEKAYQSSVGNKKIAKKSQNDMGGGVFAGGLVKNLNTITDVSFKTKSNNSFTGTGTNSRNEKFNTIISARVVKVLPNDNYFISGNRELLLNGTKQIMRISGVIRAYDIDQFNQIDSKYLSDAKILYETEGDIRESTRKPWGTKIAETIWPF